MGGLVLIKWPQGHATEMWVLAQLPIPWTQEKGHQEPKTKTHIGNTGFERRALMF